MTRHEDPMTYEVMAKYYDESYVKGMQRQDAAFYRDAALQAAGGVLEIACGTGRLLLDIARAGVEIHGVDHAPHMLAELRRKLAGEPEAVRRRVALTEGDMRSFDLARQFGLIIIPFRPMQHMYSADDQLAALANAKRHLAPGGTLLFDVFNPKLDRIYTGVGEERLELEWVPDAAPHQVIRRYFKKTGFNKREQFFTGEFYFRTLEGERLIREEVDVLKMNFYTYPQLELLARLSGLRIAAVYGDFDKSPLTDDSPEIILALTQA